MNNISAPPSRLLFVEFPLISIAGGGHFEGVWGEMGTLAVLNETLLIKCYNILAACQLISKYLYTR